MSWDLLGLWGCDRNGIGLDLWNCARTTEYWRKFAPSSFGVTNPDCCPDISALLPVDPGFPNLWVYDNPIVDDAWWYTDTRPESSRFLGFTAINVSGIDNATTTRTSNQTGSCNRSLVHGPLEDDGFTIVVEGILRGISCCDTRYGLEALRQVLRGCGCGSCQGSKLRMLSCVPDEPGVCDPNYTPLPGTTNPWRTFTNVVVKEQPVVVNKAGVSCGRCGCGQLTVVRFSLRANPGIYLDETSILGPVVLGTATCEVVCDTTTVCPDDDTLIDPFCAPVLLPDPPDVTASCFCNTPFVHQSCFVVDLGDRIFESELEAVIKAGSGDLRNLRVSIWKEIPGLPFGSGAYTDCNRCAGFAVSYVPRGAVWERTACGGTRVKTFNRSYSAASTLLDPSGQPGSPCIRLPCGRVIICIESDTAYTPADATIELFVREVEP